MVAWMGRDIFVPIVSVAGRRSRVVLETRVLSQEGELYGADGSVTLLADDDLGDALVGRILVVDLVAVDEEDHVRVLLDGPGFAQVRHHRALVRALLEGA